MDVSSGNEMSERPIELQAILAEVRRRWTHRALLRAWTLARLPLPPSLS